MKKRKKRWAALFLSLILCLTGAVSCTQSETAGQDQQTNGKYSRIEAHFTESEDAYYATMGPFGIGSDYLIYMDKESGVSGRLCGKPECTHGDSTCNAYTGGFSYGLSVYDQHLYWVSGSASGFSLWSEKLDGTDREEVLELGSITRSVGTRGLSAKIHQGYLYLAAFDYRVEGAEPKDYANIYEYNMKTGEVTEVMHLLAKTGAFFRYKMQAIDGKIYIMQSEGTDISDSYVLRIYEWDQEKKSLTEILDDEDAEFIAYDMWVEPEEGIYLVNHPYVNSECALYRYDFDTKNMEKCYSIPKTEIVGESGVMGHAIVEDHVMHIFEGLIYDQTYLQDCVVRAYDFEGNKLIERIIPVRQLLPEKYVNEACTVEPLGGDQEALYYEFVTPVGYALYARIPLDVQEPIQILGANDSKNANTDPFDPIAS